MRRADEGFPSPRTSYAADLAGGNIAPDPAQAVAVDSLQRIFDELAISQRPRRGRLLGRFLGRRQPRWEPVRGLYLWGNVGRGKTYLVDLFHACLPPATAVRIHFHSFMRRIHLELRGLQQRADPLVEVAARWAARHRVLCLDEFHVGDITDAMVLARLLEALFDQGVTLLATSNEAPAALYAGGLQRQRFLPAIAMLERHLEVLELGGTVDYRLRTLEQAPVYYRCPRGGCHEDLERSFRALAPGADTAGETLVIEGHAIPTQRLADGTVWFAFADLCEGARSTVEYIEIARCHHTVILSDVPILGADDNDAARRFINLIDEFYDRNVKLIVSAAAEPEQLYRGGRLDKAFERTASRLREMRSHLYLTLPHISD